MSRKENVFSVSMSLKDGISPGHCQHDFNSEGEIGHTFDDFAKDTSGHPVHVVIVRREDSKVWLTGQWRLSIQAKHMERKDIPQRSSPSSSRRVLRRAKVVFPTGFGCSYLGAVTTGTLNKDRTVSSVVE